jgi:hypothetical protein
MEIHGTIAQNLEAAVASSRRLKGHPIHKDTLAFWSDLIGEARARRAAGEQLEPEAEQAMAELEVVLAQPLISGTGTATNVKASGVST